MGEQVPHQATAPAEQFINEAQALAQLEQAALQTAEQARQAAEGAQAAASAATQVRADREALVTTWMDPSSERNREEFNEVQDHLKKLDTYEEAAAAQREDFTTDGPVKVTQIPVSEAYLQTLPAPARDRYESSLRKQRTYGDYSLGELAKAQAQAELDDNKTAIQDIQPELEAKIEAAARKTHDSHSDRAEAAVNDEDVRSFWQGKVEQIKANYKESKGQAADKTEAEQPTDEPKTQTGRPAKAAKRSISRLAGRFAARRSKASEQPSDETTTEDAPVLNLVSEPTEAEALADDGTKIFDMEAYIAAHEGSDSRLKRSTRIGRNVLKAAKGKVVSWQETSATVEPVETEAAETTDEPLADVVPIAPEQRQAIEDDAMPVDMDALIAEQDHEDQDHGLGVFTEDEPAAAATPAPASQDTKKGWELPAPDGNGLIKLRLRDAVRPSRNAARLKAEAEIAARKEYVLREQAALQAQAEADADENTPHLTAV